MKIAAVLAVTTLALLGCSKKEEFTAKTSDGTLNMTKDGEDITSVKLEGDKGTVELKGGSEGEFNVSTTDPSGERKTTLSMSEADPAEFGVPLYPGSTPGVSQPKITKMETPSGTTIVSMRSTTDAPGKVIDYYDNLLKEKSSYKGDEVCMSTGKNDAGDIVVVHATKNAESGKTDVSLSVTKGAKKG